MKMLRLSVGHTGMRSEDAQRPEAGLVHAACDCAHNKDFGCRKALKESREIGVAFVIGYEDRKP